jgi:hypothetical protein
MRGVAMSSFEWMELQTLTSDITAARSRLAAARSKKDSRLIRVLEEEITTAEDRRARLLANITDQLSGDAEQTAVAAASPAGETAIVAPGGATTPPPAPEIAVTAAPAEPPAHSVTAAFAWDRLSRGDIERAMETLRARRAEMLARHAAELKSLQVDRIQVEALDAAIDAFTRKFAASGGRGAVVQLDEEREMRAQNRA